MPLINYKTLFFLTFIFFTNFLFAQNEFSKWYFGDKAGIDFISGSPVILTNSKTQGVDNTCSIADSAGNLLFYFDGINVYNKNHSVMSGGTGLNTNQSSGHVGVSIRKPGTGKIYYLFTVMGFAGTGGLCYTIIDMSKNGGLGSVTSKNTQMASVSSEKLILAKNSNNADIWLITHKWNSNVWDVYPITKTGVGTPVTSAIGSSIGTDFNDAAGNVDIDLKYTRVVHALYYQDKVEILDFNSGTGKLSNVISIGNITRAWGVQLSPNASKLYVSQWTTDKLYQFDLSTYTQTAIQNSKTSIGPATGPDGGYKAGYLMLAPDKKIYVSKYLSPYLGVINNPDASGTSCNYRDSGLKLTPGVGVVGLPNKTFDIIPCSINKPYLGRDTIICKGVQLMLKDTTKNVSTYLWSDNSNMPSLTVNKAGQYWVEIAIGNCKQRDTINVGIKNPPKVSLGKDSVLCDFTNFTIGANLNGPKYLWNTSETTKTIKPAAPGTYWVQVDSNGCKASDTVLLTLNNLSKPVLGNDTSACDGETISINGFTSNAKTYNWSTGNKVPVQDITTSGTYILSISDNKCTLSDTVRVTFIPYPKVNLGRDTGFCGNFSLTLNAANPGLNKMWSTGQITLSITVINQHGLYWVDVSNQGCKTRDTLIINKLNGPNISLGNDSVFCTPVSLILNAQNPGMKYLWNNGSTAQTYSVNSPGKYWLQITDNFGCVVSDTIVLKDSSFSFSFRQDTTVCFGKTVILTGRQKPFINTWNTGDTSSTILVTQAGIYKVIISNGSCKLVDSIRVNIRPQIKLDLGNDTSLCNDLNEFLDLNGPSGFKNYYWQPGGETSSGIIVMQPGLYSLKVTDSDNCEADDNISVVKLCPLGFWVPSIFVPGNEGINSKFGVTYQGPPVEGFEMLVYSRWGELLYKSNDINTYWDGSYQGKPCQLGMYLCIIHFNSKLGGESKRNMYKGMFYLSR